MSIDRWSLFPSERKRVVSTRLIVLGSRQRHYHNQYDKLLQTRQRKYLHCPAQTVPLNPQGIVNNPLLPGLRTLPPDFESLFCPCVHCLHYTQSAHAVVSNTRGFRARLALR